MLPLRDVRYTFYLYNITIFSQKDNKSFGIPSLDKSKVHGSIPVIFTLFFYIIFALSASTFCSEFSFYLKKKHCRVEFDLVFFFLFSYVPIDYSLRFLALIYLETEKKVFLFLNRVFLFKKRERDEFI